MKRNKPSNIKKILPILIIFVAIFSLIIYKGFEDKDKKMDSHDLRIGIINDEGVALVSISEDRKMINVLKVNESVPLWLPQGLGWFNANQINENVKKSKISDLDKKMFWYNFGFVPETIINDGSVDSWKDDRTLMEKMGLVKWLKFKNNRDQMLLKEEVINKDIWKDKNSILDEIMSRDFAENQILNEDLKVSVYNATAESGLADFISRRLEWSGFSVLSAENTTETIENCLLKYGPEAEKNLGLNVLRQYFECKVQFDGNLSENEAELYFGDKFVSMLKYSSYKRL